MIEKKKDLTANFKIELCRVNPNPEKYILLSALPYSKSARRNKIVFRFIKS